MIPSATMRQSASTGAARASAARPASHGLAPPLEVGDEIGDSAGVDDADRDLSCSESLPAGGRDGSARTISKERR